MRKVVLSLCLVLVAAVWASAQPESKPKPSPRVEADGSAVKIAYGQPSKKGRVIFGAEGSSSLEKYGKVWRIGANEATEITFKKDGSFAGQPVKAGTYTLFAVPTEADWTLILNSQLGQWGAYKYEEFKEKDVLKVTVPNKQFDEPLEKLTFTASDNTLDFQWDQSGFSVPLEF